MASNTYQRSNNERELATFLVLLGMLLAAPVVFQSEFAEIPEDSPATRIMQLEAIRDSTFRTHQDDARNKVNTQQVSTEQDEKIATTTAELQFKIQENRQCPAWTGGCKYRWWKKVGKLQLQLQVGKLLGEILRNDAEIAARKADESSEKYQDTARSLAAAQQKERYYLSWGDAALGLGVAAGADSSQSPAQRVVFGSVMLCFLGTSHGATASSIDEKEESEVIPAQLEAPSPLAGTASSEVHSLDGTRSESSDDLMESVSGQGGSTSLPPALNEMLTSLDKKFAAQMAAQKEDMEKQLAAQKEEMKKQLTAQKQREAAQTKKIKQHEATIQQHEAREAVQTKKIQKHEQKLREYEAKDAEQVKILTECLKPQREAQAKLQSEIETLGAETKATEAKLSAAEKQRQAEQNATAVHPRVGEDAKQAAKGGNNQGWVNPGVGEAYGQVKYVSQDTGANSCSEGTLVDSEEACKKVVETLDSQWNPYKGAVNNGNVPKGCVKLMRGRNGGEVYHNDHPTGAAHSDYSPVCSKPLTVEERLARLEEQADGCPYDLKPEDDMAWCKEEHCVPNGDHVPKTRCRWLCNPNCNPALPFVEYTGTTYVPAATIADGHRHCDDKYTVMAQETHVYRHGSDLRLNRHKKEPIRVAVCGKCVSNEYSLHPAYASDGKILGVCKLLEHHDLYKLMDTACGKNGKNDDGSYCSGVPMPLKCQEFVKEWGMVGLLQNGTYTYDEYKKGDDSFDKRALAFTCAHVSITDTATEVAYGSNGDTKGKVQRLVRGEIAECHSQRESNPHDLGCVNKQVVKSCHTQEVKWRASSKAEASTAWDATKLSMFEVGVEVAEEGTPSTAGCYFRQPNGCRGSRATRHFWGQFSNPKTDWTLDNWGMRKAGSGNSQSNCEGRKSRHDRWCGNTDSEWLFVAGNKWVECDALALRKATSVGRL